MLLTDVQPLSHLQVIEEASAKNSHRPTVRGLFQRANEANQNKRIYPLAILENQVKKLQPLIKERRLCGELDHPQNDTVKLTNASHLVTKLWMSGNDVMGEAEILNTPNGKVAQALISDGVKIGISSRGLGTLSEDHITGQKTVNEDYNLVTFDLVADPSTRGAYPSLAEGNILEEARYERTLKEAVSERVFITMLKNRLMETKGKSGSEGDWWEGAKKEESSAEKKRTKMFGMRTVPNTGGIGGYTGKGLNVPKKFLPARDDPYGGRDDPNRSEPEHLATARRANYSAEQQVYLDREERPSAKKKNKGGGFSGLKKWLKGRRKGPNDSIEYLYTRSMERLSENNLKNRVRDIVEDSKKGYPKLGIKGGTVAAQRVARKRGAYKK